MLIHALPFIASFFYTFAYRQKAGKACALLSIFGSLTYVIYNYVIDAHVAFLIGPLGIFYILSTLYFTEHSIKIGVAYLLSVLIVSVLSFLNLWDALPFFATLFSTISLNFQKSEFKRKSLGIVSCSFWLVYAVFVDACGMVFTTSIFIISTAQSLKFVLLEHLKNKRALHGKEVRV
ncbi:MAG: YgjV family protein [Pseudomonadota bacterium]